MAGATDRLTDRDRTHTIGRRETRVSYKYITLRVFVFSDIAVLYDVCVYAHNKP